MSSWLVFSTTMAAVRAVSSSISSSASCSSCDALRRCRPFGQADEVVGKPVERGQHGRERGRDLHDGAERQLAREIFRRRQQHREDRREEGVAVQHPGQVAVLAHDVEPARRPRSAKVSLSRSRSSSAPLISAMLSAFSRTRVSS